MKIPMLQSLWPDLSIARLVLAALGIALAGCATRGTTNPPTPAQPLSPPPVSGRPVPDTMAAEASVEAVRHFNFVVETSGSGPVDAVRQKVEGRLADAGYKLNPSTPDILVNLAVEIPRKPFDTAGEFIRYEGTVEAGVNRTWDNKRLGFDTVSVQGKRGLGKDEAMRNLTAELADGAASLVIKYSRPEQSGLAVTDVTLKRPWIVDRDPGTLWIYDKDPQYVQRFIRTVRQTRGVVYCALVAQDYQSRALTFRVVYLADAMPEGILNRIVTLPDFKIHPRN